VSEAAATFWNQRYRDHSAACSKIGYGCDLVALARRGLAMTGIDPSEEGQHMAEARLAALGVKSVTLLRADFTEARLPESGCDAMLCHRTLHLMTEPGAAGRFAGRLAAVARPGAVVCIGTRDLRDLDPARMNSHHHGDDVYEYSDRPGHVISYWDDDRFHKTFAADFDIVALEQASELEASDNPVPCYLTIMVARRRPAGEAPPGTSGRKRRRSPPRP